MLRTCWPNVVIRGVVAYGRGIRIGPIIFIQVLFDKGLMRSSCQHLAFEYRAEQLTLSELGIPTFL